MKTTDKKRGNICLSEDTIGHLKQYAWENHTSASHTVTEWIWYTKVKNEPIRGQASPDLK